MSLINYIFPNYFSPTSYMFPIYRVELLLQKKSVHELRIIAEKFWNKSQIPWGIPFDLWVNAPKLSDLVHTLKNKSLLPRGTP